MLIWILLVVYTLSCFEGFITKDVDTWIIDGGSFLIPCSVIINGNYFLSLNIIYFSSISCLFHSTKLSSITSKLYYLIFKTTDDNIIQASKIN